MSTGMIVAKGKKPAKSSGGENSPESEAAGKKKKVKQANVKIAADLVHKLGVISQWRQKSISAIVDPQLRPFVEQEFRLVAREMSRAADGLTADVEKLLAEAQQQPEGSEGDSPGS